MSLVMESVVSSDLWGMGIPPAEKVIRTVLFYLGIAVIIRVAGKRLMAQMNTLDLVVVLLLSNVVQNAIIGADNSLSGGMLGAVVLVAVNAVLERVAGRYKWLDRIVEGRPTAVVIDGHTDEAALRRLGMTHYELHSALRHQGADAIHEVKLASLAPGGTIAVDLKADDQNASQGDLRKAVEELKSYIDARAR